MNLLFSITYFSPYISGLTLYAKRLAQALSKRGSSVTVLCMKHDPKLQEHESLNDVKITRAQPVIKVSKGFLSIDWVIKSIILTWKCDKLLVALPQVEGLIPVIFARIFRKKVISIYLCEVVLPPGFMNAISEKILHGANLLSLLLSHQIVTLTEDYASSSKLLTRFKHKLTYIYPLIYRPIISKRIQKYIKKRIVERPDYIIGFAGRLASEKGIEYLLQAISSLKEKLNYKTFKIVIVGPLEPVGEAAYKEKIYRLVRKYKNQIIFLGTIEGDFMGSFYSLIDVLVLPSINSTEAFGMVQVEAMIMGAPVIASDLPGVRVPIQKTGMGLLVPIKNSQKLAEAIATVLTNKNKFIKSQDYLLDEFNLQKTIDFYQGLLS